MVFKAGTNLKACMKKWQRVLVPCAACDDVCWKWCLCGSNREERIVPGDVPKGHLVVYVGECRKRFVIKVTLLKHPLFQALLDQAREVYDYNAGSKLCIPCDENIFLNVIQCAKSPHDRHMRTCL